MRHAIQKIFHSRGRDIPNVGGINIFSGGSSIIYLITDEVWLRVEIP
jgi:hypothetical protein